MDFAVQIVAATAHLLKKPILFINLRIIGGKVTVYLETKMTLYNLDGFYYQSVRVSQLILLSLLQTSELSNGAFLILVAYSDFLSIP